jgi:hypothetical protein
VSLLLRGTATPPGFGVVQLTYQTGADTISLVKILVGTQLLIRSGIMYLRWLADSCIDMYFVYFKTNLYCLFYRFLHCMVRSGSGLVTQPCPFQIL